MGGHGVLIAGGYGVVGRRLASDLAPDYPGRIIVAGRNIEQAQRSAAAIGHGATGRQLDVTQSASIAEALEGVAVVVSCIDQPGRKLFRAALQRGLGYTDITPHLNALGRGAAYDEVVAAARASGARIVLGTGIVPGISNVIVRALAEMLGGADAIETALLLNADDVSGPASFEYFLQELAMTFVVRVKGTDRRTRPFSAPTVVEFPQPIGRRYCYLFPFSDQVLYPHTMAVRTSVTRLAIDPSWLGAALAALSWTRAVKLLTIGAIRHLLARSRRDRPSSEGKPFALRVDVRRGSRSRQATLLGRTQAEAAAAGAAGVARVLLDGDIVKTGAWMPEEVVPPEPFLSRLQREGLRVQFPAE